MLGIEKILGNHAGVIFYSIVKCASLVTYNFGICLYFGKNVACAYGYCGSMDGGVMRILILVVLMLAFSSTSFAACYTVYDKSDKPVYKSSEPPFDLSIPISEGIKSKYPGGYLIQSSERASCYLRSKESNEALKKSKEAFENRRIQLQSQGFSEVRNDKITILSFPKEVVVGWPLNNSADSTLATRGGIYSSNDNGGYESPANPEQIKWRVRASGEGSDCVGYIGPGGPCSIGPGGGLSIGPGGGLSIGPGGGRSIGPGGGLSIGPGGGLSIGPGGGLSIGPGGGQSIGPGGGLSIGPGGGQSIGPGGGLSIGPGNNWRQVPLD